MKWRLDGHPFLPFSYYLASSSLQSPCLTMSYDNHSVNAAICSRHCHRMVGQNIQLLFRERTDWLHRLTVFYVWWETAHVRWNRVRRDTLLDGDVRVCQPYALKCKFKNIAQYMSYRKYRSVVEGRCLRQDWARAEVTRHRRWVVQQFGL